MSVLPEYSGARFPTGVASTYVRGDRYPVEIEPDLRLDMTPSLSFTEAEVLIRQIHAAAGAPHVRVTLETFGGERMTSRFSGDT